MNPDEEAFVHQAYAFLDRPSFFTRLASVLGRPIETAMDHLPDRQRRLIQSASESALKKGLIVVAKSVRPTSVIGEFHNSNQRSRRLSRWHSVANFGLGAAGGWFGFASLPLELPLTTGLMLRSIVAIAREFGLDTTDPRVQLECLYILSLGGTPCAEDGLLNGSAYWTSRLAFAQLTREAAGFVAQKSALELTRAMEGAGVPVLARFLTAIASRFELVVTEKLVAEALPIIGAMGGGLVNAAFTGYFSDAARYHFGLRSLEVRHGRQVVEQIYHRAQHA